jgi:hypothetical protein
MRLIGVRQRDINLGMSPPPGTSASNFLISEIRSKKILFFSSLLGTRWAQAYWHQLSEYSRGDPCGRLGGDPCGRPGSLEPPGG